MTRMRRLRPGFSLVELLVAFTVFAIIFASAVAIMGQEVRTFARATSNGVPLQNIRFSIDEMERALRAAGIGLGNGQPAVVYVDASTMVVNGDYMSNTRNDLDAIFVDSGAADAVTTVLRAPAAALPNTAFSYPDTTYRAGADPAFAESIMFYFRPDSSTPRSDDYVLFRQVNRQPAELVADNILRDGSAPFFQYWREVRPDTLPAYLDTVRFAALPLAHSARMHMEKGDTGRFALVDSVRAVRVRFVASNGASGREEIRRAVSRLIRMPNAGLQAYNTCGDAPLAPGTLTVTLTDVSGRQVPQLHWTRSPDENGGERDVYRYVIYRAEGAPVFADPYLSIPSGSPDYVYEDAQAAPHTSYYYTVAAQDCTPQIGAKVGAVAIDTP